MRTSPTPGVKDSALTPYDGVNHGFMFWVGVADKAGAAMSEICQWLAAPNRPSWSGTRLAITWRRWCHNEPPHRTDRSADGSTKRRTVSTGCDGADCSAASCADEATADRPLNGIVWIGAGR